MRIKYARVVVTKSSVQLLKVTFQYNVDLKNSIKRIDGSRWHPKKKCWTIPLNIKNVKKLQDLTFKLDQSIFRWYNKQKEIKNLTFIKGLKLTPYTFQFGGVQFIEYMNGLALIADEMGLGKTIQAIAWLQLRLELRPVVVTVPASLTLKWAREAHKWMEYPKIQILSGKTPYEITGEFLIISHSVLTYWKRSLIKIRAKALIIDESHYFKNSDAKKTIALERIAKRIPNRVGLTGTPIKNKPIEIYNVVKIINPRALPDYYQFVFTYCNAKKGAFGGIDDSGHSNEIELHKILTEKVMIRRKKSEVLKELPPITYSVVPLEISNRKEYNFAKNNFVKFMEKKLDEKLEDWEDSVKDYITKSTGKELFTQLDLFEDSLISKKVEKYRKNKIDSYRDNEPLMKIGVLKQLVVKGKLKSIVNWINDFLVSDEKLLIFCEHKFVSTHLMKHFSKIAVKIDGDITGVKRQREIDKFRNDTKIKLYIGNHEAGGVGHDLTEASNVAIIEFPWSPGDIDQDAGRAHRIPQTNAVNVHYLIGINTIEEDIIELLDEKRKMINSTIDGSNFGEVNIIKELIKRFT